MPDIVTARYRARDGSEHLVSVRRTREGRWRISDITDRETRIVEELAGIDDRLAQAEALARDYASEQAAYHRGDRLEDPLPRPHRDDADDTPCAA
jgi:hypothetical protein